MPAPAENPMNSIPKSVPVLPQPESQVHDRVPMNARR
jgi:hypothetical protein